MIPPDGERNGKGTLALVFNGLWKIPPFIRWIMLLLISKTDKQKQCAKTKFTKITLSNLGISCHLWLSEFTKSAIPLSRNVLNDTLINILINCISAVCPTLSLRTPSLSLMSHNNHTTLQEKSMQLFYSTLFGNILV